MSDYILDKLRGSARLAIDEAKNTEKVGNTDVVGRLREILIENVLGPWLPPYVSCGTGAVLDDVTVAHPQNDIVIFDTSLVPPILVGSRSKEGAFLYNGTLVRIEVKSKLKKADVTNFVHACKEMCKLHFVRPEGGWLDDVSDPLPKMWGPLNMLFAYTSDLSGEDADADCRRVQEVMRAENVEPSSGLVSALCIPGKGLWKPARKDGPWHKLNSAKAEDHLAWFVAVVSNVCFSEHIKRQGRSPDRSLEGGIGWYIPGDGNTWVDLPKA